MTINLHFLTAFFVLLFCAVILPSSAYAICGEECDEQYSSDVDTYHSNYGDDPSDTGDLTACIQDAKDNYASCVDDCADRVIALATGRKSVIAYRDCIGEVQYPQFPEASYQIHTRLLR